MSATFPVVQMPDGVLAEQICAMPHASLVRHGGVTEWVYAPRAEAPAGRAARGPLAWLDEDGRARPLGGTAVVGCMARRGQGA